MHRLHGGCHCGNIKVEVGLTRQPADYRPRACDCDFCRMHGACYVSDASGNISFRVEHSANLGRYRQGSGLAELLFCKSCGVLVGGLFHRDDRCYATVNVKALEDWKSFGTEEVVSPKVLSKDEKVDRWERLWFSAVVLDVRA